MHSDDMMMMTTTISTSATPLDNSQMTSSPSRFVHQRQCVALLFTAMILVLFTVTTTVAVAAAAAAATFDAAIIEQQEYDSVQHLFAPMESPMCDASFAAISPFVVSHSVLHEGFNMTIKLKDSLPEGKYLCRGQHSDEPEINVLDAPVVFLSQDDRDLFNCTWRMENPDPDVHSYTFGIVIEHPDTELSDCYSPVPGIFHVVSTSSIVSNISSIIPMRHPLDIEYQIPNFPAGTYEGEYKFSIQVEPVRDFEDKVVITSSCMLEEENRVKCTVALSDDILYDDIQPLNELLVELWINGNRTGLQSSVMVYQDLDVTSFTISAVNGLVSVEQLNQGNHFIILDGRNVCVMNQPTMAQFTLNSIPGFESKCIPEFDGIWCVRLTCPLPMVLDDIFPASDTSVLSLNLSRLHLTEYNYIHSVDDLGASVSLYRASSVSIARLGTIEMDHTFPSESRVELQLETLHDTGSIEVHIMSASFDGLTAKLNIADIDFSTNTITANGTLLFPSTTTFPRDLRVRVSLDGGLTTVDMTNVEINSPHIIEMAPLVLNPSSPEVSFSLSPAPITSYRSAISFAFLMPDKSIIPTTTTTTTTTTSDSVPNNVPRYTVKPILTEEDITETSSLTLQAFYHTEVLTPFNSMSNLFNSQQFPITVSQYLSTYAGKNVKLMDISPRIITTRRTENLTIFGEGFPTHLDPQYICARVGDMTTSNVRVVNDTTVVVYSLQDIDFTPTAGAYVGLSFDECRTFYDIDDRILDIIPLLEVEIRETQKELYAFKNRQNVKLYIGNIFYRPENITVAICYKGDMDIIIYPDISKNFVFERRTDDPDNDAGHAMFDFALPQDVKEILPANIVDPEEELNSPIEQFTIGFSQDGINYAWTAVTLHYSELKPTLVGLENDLERLIPTNQDNRNVTFFGVDMSDQEYQCHFETKDKKSSTSLVERVDDSRWRCAIPPRKSPGTISMKLKYLSVISDEHKDANGEVTLSYYEIPELIDVSPRKAPMQGQTFVNVTVKNMDTNLNLYAQFGGFSSPECTTVMPLDSQNRSIVECQVPPNPTDNVTIRISYNMLDWFSNNGSPQFFEYELCPDGFEAQSYEDPCTPCKPGTYKPTAGLYSCFDCPVDSFASEYGATQCTPCPINSITVPRNSVGKTSVYDCQCNLNYMVNPEHILMDHISQETILSEPDTRCLPCPVGGNCNSTITTDPASGITVAEPRYNTTIPHSQPGYWFDPVSNHTLFFKCYPQSSCPGGNYRNCTNEYTGIRCGQCSLEHYKLRNQCVKCSGDGWLRLLICVIILTALICAFFLFSSISISHISSVSIAFSFWQVISIFSSFDIPWPSSVNTSFTAASVFNFNTDFLNMQCIFPQLDFVAKWILALMFPVACFLGFVVFYLCSEIRSLLAGLIGRRLFGQFQYWHSIEMSPLDQRSRREANGETMRQKISKVIRRWAVKQKTALTNVCIYGRNLVLWTVKQQLTRRQHKVVFNKCVNSFLTFLSFSFIFMMTQSSIIFKCTEQVDGSWTMDQSPDIKCYEDKWFIMLPITAMYWIVLGGGSVGLFVYLYLTRRRLNYDQDYQERFKFILRRYKTRRFYWELVVTVRKFFLSIFYTFFPPMLTVVLSMGVVFLALILHMQAVPFNKKAHNLLEYFILVATLVVLGFGLLFFVDQFPAPWMKQACVVLSLLIIVLTSAFVIVAMLWDIYVRKKKQKKKAKALEKEAMSQLGKMNIDDRMAIMNIMHNARTTLYKANKMFEARQHDATFTLPLYEVEVYDSDEDKSNNLNEVLEDLFSMRRLRRKVFLANRKRKRIETKVQRVAERIEKHKSIVLEKGRSFHQTIQRSNSVHGSPSSSPRTPRLNRGLSVWRRNNNSNSTTDSSSNTDPGTVISTLGNNSDRRQEQDEEIHDNDDDGGAGAGEEESTTIEKGASLVEK